MKTFATLALSLFLVSGMAFADSPKDADPSPAKSAPPAKSKPAAKKAVKTDASFAAELEELRQTLQSQQEQLQMLKEELGKRDRQIDEAREAAAAANARAAEASSRSFEAVTASSAVKATTESISSTVGDLKASNESLTSTVTTVAKDQAEAKKASEDGPASIKYKGITLTPGGFLAAETVFRNRADVADVNTALTGIPFNGSDLSKTTEFNFSGRQSRATLLAEGKLASWTLQGYYEADFLGAGVTSNNRQSNSYVFRQRQVFARAKSESGWGITGGQMWSLVTETKKLLDNRTEALPMTIDAQYTVGFSWARQYGLRFTKDFGSKFAAGFSIESPQTTIGGRGFPANFFTNAVGAGGGLYNFIDTAGYSVNKTPDFILKLAAEPGFGHYELYGIISTFRERNYPCATTAAAAVCLGKTGPSANGAFNDTRTGGGIGANARVSLFNKKVDAGLHFLGGDGVGRYSTAQLADVTARADGTLAPIRGGSALGTLEFHFKKDDIYLNGGTEYAFRTAYLNSTGKAGIGYGSPLFNNTGCNVEALGAAGNGTAGSVPSGTLSPANAGACAGDIRSITEGTIGFWHRFYNGPKGRLQFGMQYSYVLKNTWSGNNAGATYGQAPNAHDNMLFTSFRYYIP